MTGEPYAGSWGVTLPPGTSCYASAGADLLGNEPRGEQGGRGPGRPRRYGWRWGRTDWGPYRDDRWPGSSLVVVALQGSRRRPASAPPGERSGCGLGWAYQSRRRRDATVVCESLIPVLGVADGNVTSGVARDDARVFCGSVVVVSFSR